MASTVALVLVALVLYGARGSFGFNLWMYLNLLDSLRALKFVRPNGRRIGVVTRRNSIRQCVVCWIILPAAFLADVFLSWIPFYSSLKTLLILICLTWRLQTFVIPFIRRYEEDIDLVLSLLEALVSMTVHYLVYTPWHIICTFTNRFWDNSQSLPDSPMAARSATTTTLTPTTTPRPSTRRAHTPDPVLSNTNVNEQPRSNVDSTTSTKGTLAKSPKSSLRVPQATQAAQRRSPRRPSPRLRHPPAVNATNDVPSKSTKVAKPVAKRAAPPPRQTYTARAPDDAASAPLRRSDTAPSSPSKQPPRKTPRAEATVTAAAHAPANRSRKAPTDSAARRAAATAALLALPRPPTDDPTVTQPRGPANRSTDKATSTTTTSATRTEATSRKRTRREADDDSEIVKRRPARQKNSRTVESTATDKSTAVARSGRSAVTSKAAAAAAPTKRKAVARTTSEAEPPAHQTKRRRIVKP